MGKDCHTLLGAFWDTWNARDDQVIVYAKGEDIRTVAKLAERMLRAFQRSGFARPSGHIIAVEEELRGPLADGFPDLLARVDLIEDVDGALVVTDLKTARGAWSLDHVLDAASQLWLYSQLVERLADGRPIRLPVRDADQDRHSRGSDPPGAQRPRACRTDPSHRASESGEPSKPSTSIRAPRPCIVRPVPIAANAGLGQDE